MPATDARLLEQDLDEYIEGESWPQPDDQGEPIPPADEAAAAGIMRRMHRLEREAKTINAVADADVSRINAWRADRLGTVQRDIAWAKRSLESFARVFMPPRKRRTYATPDGTLKLTKPGTGSVVFTSESTLIAWVETEGIDMNLDEGTAPIVTYTPSVSKIAITKRFEAKQTGTTIEAGIEYDIYKFVGPGGEAVPGVIRRVPSQDRFDLNLAEEA